MVKDHGLQYLFATTILIGICNPLCVLKLGRQMKYAPQSQMIGPGMRWQPIYGATA